MEQSVKCLAPAKLNLTLAVVGKRDDGFHELVSWVQPVSWFDRLEITPHEQLALKLGGDLQDIPTDQTNLAYRAAILMGEAAGISPDVKIILEKFIPSGAGLGGGSSDAAAVITGLNRLWNLNWPVEKLTHLAATLGSDVPLFVQPGSAVIRGRGEQIETLAYQWHGWTAIVSPGFSISTIEVYQRLQVNPNRDVPVECWREAGCAKDLMPRLYNDLEPAAFAVEPRLAVLHDQLNSELDRPVRMTGSGSALFSLFDTQEEARRWKSAAAELLPAGARVHVACMNIAENQEFVSE